MPATRHRKTDPLDTILKLRMTASDRADLKALAQACGVTVSGLVRDLIAQASAGADTIRPPKPARNMERQMQAVEMHTLAMQVKKLGTNINQLARQANTGLVPVSRAELQYMLNQHQLLMAKAIVAIEKAF